MRISVRFFAHSRELAGAAETTLEFTSESCSLSDFESVLLSQFPLLEEIWPAVALSRNLEYISRTDSVKLQEGDEIGIIPPVSGG